MPVAAFQQVFARRLRGASTLTVGQNAYAKKGLILHTVKTCESSPFSDLTIAFLHRSSGLVDI